MPLYASNLGLMPLLPRRPHACSTPLKKLAEPRDVATQVLALASPTLSGHVTGQVVMVHGGMEGRLLNREEDI